eukprot:m.94058 g.94058  ORF g.94058 m.94058 type:complete len:137 (-) comp13015_c1_seq2:3658-4068(-)
MFRDRSGHVQPNARTQEISLWCSHDVSANGWYTNMVGLDPFFAVRISVVLEPTHLSDIQCVWRTTIKWHSVLIITSHNLLSTPRYHETGARAAMFCALQRYSNQHVSVHKEWLATTPIRLLPISVPLTPTHTCTLT